MNNNEEKLPKVNINWESLILVKPFKSMRNKI